MSAGVPSVVELRDRDVIAGVLRRRAAVHAYELGDLDDFFWPRTRWFGWRPGAEIEQVALLYNETDPPVLLALADASEEGMAELLQAISSELPVRVYAHLSPGLVDALRPRLVPESDPVLHRKLALVDPARLDRHDAQDVITLSPSDRIEVEAFYRAAYPGSWFRLRMLETGRYVGIRRDGALVCVAGVHVWSPTWGVATLGNVATVPALRGAGLATAACARLCLMLLDDGIDVISLNVRADNAAAIRAYEKLGFTHAADYVEVSLGPVRECSTETDVETRLGAYAVMIDDRERILLALWNEGPTPAWTLPGGGAEPGETSEQAAVREVLEETGYHVELGRLLGEDAFSVAAAERLDGSGRPLRAVRHVYEARIAGGQLRDEVDGTTDRAEWIPIAAVPGLERVELVDVALRLAQRWPK